MVTRVLIVEDQKIMQKHFEEIIAGEREFCHIKTIRDASQAAACCAGNQVDLVLMDVQTLHNNSGLTAAKDHQRKISMDQGGDHYLTDRSGNSCKIQRFQSRWSLV